MVSIFYLSVILSFSLATASYSEDHLAPDARRTPKSQPAHVGRHVVRKGRRWTASVTPTGGTTVSSLAAEEPVSSGAGAAARRPGSPVAWIRREIPRQAAHSTDGVSSEGGEDRESQGARKEAGASADEAASKVPAEAAGDDSSAESGRSTRSREQQQAASSTADAADTASGQSATSDRAGGGDTATSSSGATSDHEDGADSTGFAANTNASQEKQARGSAGSAGSLPGWALVMIGSTSAALSVYIASRIGDAVASSNRPPTDEQPLSEELVTAQRHVQALEAAVQAQREAEQQAQLEVAQLQRQWQQVSDEPTPTQPDNDVLTGEMLARTIAMERSAADQAESIAKELGAPQLIARAGRVKDIVQDGVSDLRSHVEEMARREGAALIEKVQDAMDVDLTAFTAPLEIMEGLPPVGIVVAGMAAPMQLRSIKASAETSILLNGILMSVGSGVGFVDWDVPCHDMQVWVWLLVLIGISFLLVFSHTLLRSQCEMALDDIATDQAKVETVRTGNGVWDTFLSVRNGSGPLFKALYRYDKIANSWAYAFTKMGGFAYLLWGGFGLYVTIMDVVVDAEVCNVKSVLFFMHFFSFFYLLFLTWFLFGQVVYLVPILAMSSTVSNLLLRKAKEWDDSSPLQMPIYLTLVRAFVLRKSSDLLQVAKDQMNSEIEVLEEQAARVNRELAQKRSEAERINAELSQACQNEEQLIEKYEQQLQDSFERAEPLVAVAAAASGATPPAGTHSSTAGSSGAVDGGMAASAAATAGLGGMFESLQEQASSMAASATAGMDSMAAAGAGNSASSSALGILGTLQEQAAVATAMASGSEGGVNMQDMLGTLQQQAAEASAAASAAAQAARATDFAEGGAAAGLLSGLQAAAASAAASASAASSHQISSPSTSTGRPSARRDSTSSRASAPSRLARRAGSKEAAEAVAGAARGSVSSMGSQSSAGPSSPPPSQPGHRITAAAAGEPTSAGASSKDAALPLGSVGPAAEPEPASSSQAASSQLPHASRAAASTDADSGARGGADESFYEF